MGVFLQQQCAHNSSVVGASNSQSAAILFSLKVFSFPFCLSWNLPLFPSLIRLLLALTISPSLILPGTLVPKEKQRFVLDSKLSMKKQVKKICHTAYFELKHISLICRFLTEDATKTQGNTAVYGVTSYILSQLHYCNCLLMGTPNSVIQPLQKIQNFAARLVLLAPHHPLSTPLLEKTALFFLSISECVSIKLLVCISVL